MKNTNFEKNYQKLKRYMEEADDAVDAKAKSAAYKKVNDLYNAMKEKGDDYYKAFRLYEEAKDCENEFIDIHDPIVEADIRVLLEAFRKYEIKKFTFSNGWTDAVETAWRFVQNGCSVEGMAEINGTNFNPRKGAFERVHGYIFSVN